MEFLTRQAFSKKYENFPDDVMKINNIILMVCTCIILLSSFVIISNKRCLLSI